MLFNIMPISSTDPPSHGGEDPDREATEEEVKMEGQT